MQLCSPTTACIKVPIGGHLRVRATNRSSRRATATSAAVQQVVCKGFAVVTRRFSVIIVPPQAEDELPLVYDPDRVVEYVRRRPWLVVARVSQITAACTQYLSFKLQQGASERLKGLLPEQSAQREDPSAARQEGQLICNLLTGLGPTFVKLGQILSVRPDVVGEQLSQDLAQLQDSCPAFGGDEAMAILEQQLGAPPSTFFSAISEQPIAAASLGQVYRCTVRGTGREVAVKIQRPGIVESITLDIAVVRGLLGAVRQIGRVNQDIRSLADELGGGLMQELDYVQEAANASSFLAAHGKLGFINVPEPLLELTTTRVLTSEWVDGKAPAQLLEASTSSSSAREREAAAAQLLALVQMGVQCSLAQLLETGVVHADPHPGNLLLAPSGRLVYLDFGLLSRVTPERSQAMMAALAHVAMGSWARLCVDLDALGAVKAGTDFRALAADLEGEFTRLLPTSALAASQGQRLVALVRTQGAGIGFGQFFQVVVKLAFKYRFRLAPEYLLVVRSIATLEGIALRADPDFKIVAAAVPVVLKQLLGDCRPGALQLLRELIFTQQRTLQLETLAELALLWVDQGDRLAALVAGPPGLEAGAEWGGAEGEEEAEEEGEVRAGEGLEGAAEGVGAFFERIGVERAGSRSGAAGGLGSDGIGGGVSNTARIGAAASSAGTSAGAEAAGSRPYSNAVHWDVSARTSLPPSTVSSGVSAAADAGASHSASYSSWNGSRSSSRSNRSSSSSGNLFSFGTGGAGSQRHTSIAMASTASYDLPPGQPPIPAPSPPTTPQLSRHGQPVRHAVRTAAAANHHHHHPPGSACSLPPSSLPALLLSADAAALRKVLLQLDVPEVVKQLAGSTPQAAALQLVAAQLLGRWLRGLLHSLFVQPVLRMAAAVAGVFGRGQRGPQAQQEPTSGVGLQLSRQQGRRLRAFVGSVAQRIAGGSLGMYVALTALTVRVMLMSLAAAVKPRKQQPAL